MLGFFETVNFSDLKSGYIPELVLLHEKISEFEFKVYYAGR